MSAGAPGGEYASSPLPEHLTVAGWRVALIVASFNIALPGFLNGAQTGLALGFWPAALAALLAGLILCGGACLTAWVAVRTRLTTYLLIQRSFGRWGAALVNTVIAIVHYCWFGVNVSFFAGAIVALVAQGYAIPGDFTAFVIAGSMLMIVSTIFGFRALDRLALVAVPLLGVILATVAILAVRRYGLVLAPSANPPEPMSFGIALSAIVGGNMLTVAAMPDLSRYIRSVRGAVSSMVLSFPVATPLLLVAAALPALATGETDIMKLVTMLGFGLPVLLILILSIWTINAANLYSASLSMSATFPKVREWVFICLGGAVGGSFAVMGIIDSFVPFLLFLAILIPPIAAIYVIDTLVTFRDRDAAQTLEALAWIRWPAVLTWIGSIAIALLLERHGLTLTTVPMIDATILATAGYLGVMRLGATAPADHHAQDLGTD
ncbi:cytosine permease [Sphingomonas sp.]|uniref:cytosine permease n=1 Tax=Sphingomonas sp. TaxID=28214 RepID=UPI0031E33348